FTIRHFGKFIADLTGKPLRAFRAGSFRWNANTIRALQEADIPLSFNNSTHACLVGQCTYSEPTNRPYRWSNGVIEVPITERRFFPLFGKEWWGRLQFPVANVLATRRGACCGRSPSTTTLRCSCCLRIHGRCCI